MAYDKNVSTVTRIYRNGSGNGVAPYVGSVQAKKSLGFTLLLVTIVTY